MCFFVKSCWLLILFLNRQGSDATQKIYSPIFFVEFHPPNFWRVLAYPDISSHIMGWQLNVGLPHFIITSRLFRRLIVSHMFYVYLFRKQIDNARKHICNKVFRKFKELLSRFFIVHFTVDTCCLKLFNGAYFHSTGFQNVVGVL